MRRHPGAAELWSICSALPHSSPLALLIPLIDAVFIYSRSVLCCALSSTDTRRTMRGQFNKKFGLGAEDQTEDDGDLDLQFEENALIKIEQKGTTITHDISLQSDTVPPSRSPSFSDHVPVLLEPWRQLFPLYRPMTDMPVLDIFTERFIDAFAPAGHDNCGQSSAIRRAGAVMMFSPLLTQAFNAVSIAYVGQSTGSPRLVSHAYKVYCETLNCLQLALWDPRQSRSPGVFATVILLMAYEVTNLRPCTLAPRPEPPFLLWALNVGLICSI